MQEWVAEYQRLAGLGEDNLPEALKVLDMIRRLLGDLPIDEGLLPKNIYETIPPEGSETDIRQRA